MKINGFHLPGEGKRDWSCNAARWNYTMHSPTPPCLPRKLPGAAVLAALLLGTTPLGAAEPARLSVLLLGDKGHHRPADMAKVLTPVLAKAGIDVTYTDDVAALVPATLN